MTSGELALHHMSDYEEYDLAKTNHSKAQQIMTLVARNKPNGVNDLDAPSSVSNNVVRINQGAQLVSLLSGDLNAFQAGFNIIGSTASYNELNSRYRGNAIFTFTVFSDSDYMLLDNTIGQISASHENMIKDAYKSLDRDVVKYTPDEISRISNRANLVAPLVKGSTTNIDWCANPDALEKERNKEDVSSYQWSSCVVFIVGDSVAYKNITNAESLPFLEEGQNLLVTRTFLPDMFPVSKLHSEIPNTYAYIPYFKLMTLRGQKGMSEEQLKATIKEVANENWSKQSIIVDLTNGKTMDFGLSD
ncbi:hypothetical protein A136_20595 [Vibrio crassostreae 9ZC13]|uniref:hypothetical protein n=1 Tax=Vibrio crassostreae TaxID=246167 RepID=UPI000362CEA1|nr:hypothetical protein [Vibrio crassostreae]OEE99080.1 hypothetical protein A136_20595 [Vibrio crassostreae 9ZC13]